jgi:hypothetical protein
MSRPSRFDPLGWFVSTCIAILFGSMALAIAGRVLAQVWPWLLAAAGIGIGGVLLARVLVHLWRYGRQPW